MVKFEIIHLFLRWCANLHCNLIKPNPGSLPSIVGMIGVMTWAAVKTIISLRCWPKQSHGDPQEVVSVWSQTKWSSWFLVWKSSERRGGLTRLILSQNQEENSASLQIHQLSQSRENKLQISKHPKTSVSDFGSRSENWHFSNLTISRKSPIKNRINADWLSSYLFLVLM